MDITTDNLEKRLEMIFEEKRIESFKIWPYSDKDSCNIKKLAEAGFFWTGTETDPDSAQCFVCNKSLDGWESSDDPWVEHTNHAAECPFVKTRKLEEELTLEQLRDFWIDMVINVIDKTSNEHKKYLLKERDDMKKELLNFRKGRIVK